MRYPRPEKGVKHTLLSCGCGVTYSENLPAPTWCPDHPDGKKSKKR